MTFLLPETTIQKDAETPPLTIPPGSPLLLTTLGVLETVEQESLLVTLHGSADGVQWQQIAEFPERFYASTTALAVAPTPEISFIKASWKVNRWGRGSKTPLFRLYIFVEPESR